MVDNIVAKHTDFVVGLAAMAPQINLINLKSEKVGDGLTRVTLTVMNDGELPTYTKIGDRSYFLKKIIPVCEEMDVKMAIHPDDPPFELFGFPRITKNLEDLKKILSIVDSPYNGLTLCTGSLGAEPNNDMVEIIHEVGNKINFVHFRNVEFLGERKFRESAHLSTDGSLDMYAIMKALVDVGFDGVIRPDHGRTVFGEVAMPGYGLYDRAMGITYLQGLLEAITKAKG